MYSDAITYDFNSDTTTYRPWLKKAKAAYFWDGASNLVDWTKSYCDDANKIAISASLVMTAALTM